MEQPSHVNNFDLLRLLASLQVLFIHACEHLKITYPESVMILISPLLFFPGVPIFFTISGFLIIWSFERNKDQLKKFYRNRLLRIYPALWGCLLLTILVLLGFSIITPLQLCSKEMMTWLICQLTIFQFYTPDLLRSFGVGNPNGSLWTISLEIQFYLIVPILYWLIFKPAQKKIAYYCIALLCILSVSAYVYANSLPDESMQSKLTGVFLLPYLYNFIFGIIIYKEWKFFKRILSDKALYWLAFYLLYSLICSSYLKLYIPSYWPNAWGFLANSILALTIISMAYTATSFSTALLRGNDFSYGIYIYHMLVVNVFVQLSYTGSILSLGCVFILTFLLAVGSWFLIEHPILKWKSHR
jgi:peptidoglycan/LPS O-acetylase OafA/YrhL